MRIIIVGAGAVGSYLAQRLSAEGQDVVVIEGDKDRAAKLQDAIDALVVCGNGASPSVLEEAGADEADLLIAVSNSDGANVLACATADRLGTKTTIARIEDPGIAEGAAHLGVDAVIDPAANAAKDLLAVVSAGGASEMIAFADGKLVMVGGRVDHGAPITQGQLRELRPRWAEWGWVVTALVRNGRTIVAHGDTTVEPGDHALLMTTEYHVNDANRLIGLRRRNLERAIIMGGTRLAELTADVLANAGISVIIVDQDDDRSAMLAADHPLALVLSGDPTDPSFLSELDLGPNDVILALTPLDEVNVLVCLSGKALGAGMVISRFNRIAYVGLLAGVGIDAAISSRLMAASAILRFVRRGRVEQVATFSDTDAEAIEIEVEEGSPAIGKTLIELALPVGVVVGGITRQEDAFIPDGSTVVRAGDHLTFLSLPRDVEATAALFSAT